MARMRARVSDPDPVPFTQFRYFNNSGVNLRVKITASGDGAQKVPETPLNSGAAIPDGGYSGIELSAANDVDTVTVFVAGAAGPFHPTMLAVAYEDFYMHGASAVSNGNQNTPVDGHCWSDIDLWV